jgi:sortase A
VTVDVSPPATSSVATGPRRGGVGRACLRGAGELLITAGVVILLFIVYELYGTGLTTAREQDRLERQLALEWGDPPAADHSAPGEPPAAESSAPPVRPVQPPPLSSPVAVLTVPRLGEDYRHVVVEGVGLEELKKGPGHQPGTAWPGQLGNTVLAGHRTTYGAPFGRLDELAAGDDVVVTDATGSYTYRISGTEVVDPSDPAVVLPVPRQPGAEPTQRLLTLITCTPKYSAKYRLILTGELVAEEERRAV